MKRDMDLVRQILITIEDHEHGYAPQTIDIPGYGQDVIGFHVLLLGEAGLLDVTESSTYGSKTPTAFARRLRWEGYEFLGNARNETIWSKVKSTVVAKGGTVSFDVLKFLVTETAKGYFMPGSVPPLPPTI